VLCLLILNAHIINKMVVWINGCLFSQWRLDSRQNLFATGPQSGWTFIVVVRAHYRIVRTLGFNLYMLSTCLPIAWYKYARGNYHSQIIMCF
jgi:hypothetical protein